MTRKFTYLLLLVLFLFVQCKEEDNSPKLTAQFSVEYTDANNLIIKNTTAQEVGVIEWDFGNGVTAKNEQQVAVYYPLKGEYTVTLDVWKSGEHSQAEQAVSIAENALNTNVKAEIQDHPNYVMFSCNATLGEVNWDFGNRGSSTKNSVTVYFPFAGKYNVTFSATINGSPISETLAVTIDNDDATHLDKLVLVWQDEFDGNSLDEDKWQHEIGAQGWGNNELQNYTDGDNTSLEDGLLKITAKQNGTSQAVGTYTSSRLNSKQSFRYGRMEFRAKMPALKGKGLWPALWMLGDAIRQGTSWPDCGEIDMMEYVSYQPHSAFFTIHSRANNHIDGTAIGSGDVSIPDIESNFHVYGIIWTEKSLKFYLDETTNVVFETSRPSVYNNDNWPFDKPFYFLMNMAIGGDFGGAQGVDQGICPATFEIDYIRVYQHPDQEIE